MTEPRRRFGRAWRVLRKGTEATLVEPDALEPRRNVARPPDSEVMNSYWLSGVRLGGEVPPSYLLNLMQLRRQVAAVRRIPGSERHPLRQQTRKLRNYRLAASHGVSVPDILAVWPSAREIDVRGLPDRFVLKGDGGAGSAGVLPLHRVASDEYQVVSTERRMTGRQIAEFLEQRPGVRPPFFAEEMLPGGGPHGLPDDLKVFACYGEVVHIMIRRVAVHGDLRRTSYRYIDAGGEDLGPDITVGQVIDQSIPPPADLEGVVEVSRHLSRAAALPFVRVDLFETERGIVLGELTRGPGGPQIYRQDHDRRLGAAWDAARFRLDVDVQAGRPLHVLHGLHQAPNLYPAGHPSWTERDGWAVVRAPCEEWCLPTDPAVAEPRPGTPHGVVG